MTPPPTSYRLYTQRAWRLPKQVHVVLHPYNYRNTKELAKCMAPIVEQCCLNHGLSHWLTGELKLQLTRKIPEYLNSPEVLITYTPDGGVV